MNYQTLDYFFPFAVFVYGLLMTVLTSLPVFQKLSESRFHPEIAKMFLSHRTIGAVSLVVGFLWSVQNLVLSAPPL